MSAYTTRAEVEAVLSPAWLVAALTDEGANGETSGLCDQLIALAASDVDGFLCAQYAVPFVAPLPAVVVAASRIFTLWYVAERRLAGDANPYKKQREEWIERLKDIGDALKPLDRNNTRFVGSAALPDGTVQPPHWMNIGDWGDSTAGVGYADDLLNQDRVP